MKKLFLFALFVFLIGLIICLKSDNNEYSYLEDYFNKKEITFVKENDLKYEDFSLYLKYENFDILNYYLYEEVREDNYSHLEAINIVNNPNYYTSYSEIEQALFTNTCHILINKHYFIDTNFIPLSLDNLENYNLNYVKRENETMQASTIALKELEIMNESAHKEGIELLIYSAYRTFEKQEYLYYVVNLENDNYSAKPGHSEHQCGLAFDISDTVYGLTAYFEESDTFKWLIENSYKFGFILRYPKDKENITLYKFEPWHFRYVGKEIAKYIYENDLTLEEYIIKNYELF